MLKDPFYYGEFEYPVNSGIWYSGSYPHLITKKMFLKVQKLRMNTPPRAKWRSKNILFRGTFKCASCRAGVTGEESFRERLHGEPRRHVYYHCCRIRDPNCKEPFVSEEKLMSSLNKYISFMANTHPQTVNLSQKKGKTLSFTEYSQHILRNGTNEEKKEMAMAFNKQLYLHNREICGAPIN